MTAAADAAASAGPAHHRYPDEVPSDPLDLLVQTSTGIAAVSERHRSRDVVNGHFDREIVPPTATSAKSSRAASRSTASTAQTSAATAATGTSKRDTKAAAAAAAGKVRFQAVCKYCKDTMPNVFIDKCRHIVVHCTQRSEFPEEAIEAAELRVKNLRLLKRDLQRRSRLITSYQKSQEVSGIGEGQT